MLASASTALAVVLPDGAMRLSGFSGAVTVKNASGIPLEASEGMSLYNGYTVETGAAGTARIELDDSKEITLDSRSVCSVKHSGKTAETFLIAGMVFFKTERPLESDEAFIIRSRDIVNSVRGSFGWQGERELGLMYGSARVRAAGNEQLLQSGEGVSLAQALVGGTGSNKLVSSTLTNDAIPLVALTVLADSPAMQEKVDSVPTLNSQVMLGSLEDKRAAAAAEDRNAVQTAQAAVTAQNAAIGATASIYAPNAAIVPAPAAVPANPEDDNTSTVTVNPRDTEALMAALSRGSVTLDAQGWTISYSGVTVGAGQTLNITGPGTVSMPGLMIESGGTVNVSAGSSLSVSGTDLVWRGTLTNSGAVRSDADIAMVGKGACVLSDGVFTNSGVFSIAPSTSFNGGTVNNTGTIIVSVGGVFTPNSANGVVIYVSDD